ncbi:MAG: hypothetical protein NZ908_00360 [Candidatus Micrarchaeota archaeon]|nr:hypothetical protein [Candidatus Micrarchaeota archaeon]MCX8154635.1 hypothetical protein [Candidatus Micrarchaeota archaeon]
MSISHDKPNIDENAIQMNVDQMIGLLSSTCTDPIKDRCRMEDQTIAEIFESIKPQLGLFSKAIDEAVDKAIGNLYRLGAGGMGIFEDKYCGYVQNLGYITSMIGWGMIVVLSYILIDFIARIIGNSKYSAIARREIFEIIILIPLLLALLNLPCVLRLNDNVPIHSKSLLYIHSAIISSMISIIPISYYGASVAMHSITIVQNLGGGAPQTAPLAAQYYESALSLAKQAATFLTLSFIWVGTFGFMFDIFTYGFVKYLLPIAIILRSIPFTKSLGGGLIGLIIATNLFIPIILSVNYELIKMFGPGYFYYSGNNVKFKFNPWIEMVIHIFAGFVILMSILQLLMGFRLFIDVINAIQRFRVWQSIREGFRRLLGSLVGQGGGVASTLIDIFMVMRVLSVPTIRTFAFQIPLLLLIAFIVVAAIIFNILLPTLTFLFLTSTIKYLSSMFGEEFDLANLTRLI